MKLWQATVAYRLKTKSYWSHDQMLTVKAGRARLAANKAIGEAHTPKGARIEEWNVRLTDLGKVTATEDKQS